MGAAAPRVPRPPKWPDDLKIAVNLSPAQFRSPELVPVIVRALASAGYAPTGSSSKKSPRRRSSTTARRCSPRSSQLHDLGVRIALDDFGTGYSSLSFLQKFPFDKVKIDRSFVSELSGTTGRVEPHCARVVRFAVSLGKTTTAEGVETREQFEILRADACVEVQGFHFSPAVQSEKVAQMIGEGVPRRRSSVRLRVTHLRVPHPDRGRRFGPSGGVRPQRAAGSEFRMGSQALFAAVENFSKGCLSAPSRLTWQPPPLRFTRVLARWRSSRHDRQRREMRVKIILECCACSVGSGA